MVHAGWGAGDRHPLLPRPSAPHEAREVPDARGRGRDAGMVPADPPARGRSRLRQRVRAPEPAPAPAPLRPPVGALSRLLPAEAVLEKFRPPPRLVVRAEPPGRGLRGD